MPSLNSIVTSKPLTNIIADGYGDQSFIAEEVAPTIKVKDPKGKIYIRGKEKLKPYDASWKSGAKATLVDSEYDSVDYATEQYKLAYPLKRDVLNNADNPLDPRQDAAEILKDIIMLGKEKRVQAISQASGSITNTTAASVKWNAAGATPRENVNETKELIRDDTGRYPNKMIMSTDVRNALIAYFLGEAQITYGEAAKTVELPDVVFGMKPVIPMCVENTANINQTASISDVWSNVVLMVVAAKPSLHYGGAFCSPLRRNFNGDSITNEGWRVRRIKLEEEEVEKIEVASEVDELVINIDAAGTVTNVL